MNEIIRDISMQENSQIMVKELCGIGGVSRSGYYRWLNAEEDRQARDVKDWQDFEIILKAYYYYIQRVIRAQ